MNRNNHARRTCAVFFCILAWMLCLLCSCDKPLLLPSGGYDYRMTSAVDGAILGYPMPRTGSNPYRYSLPLSKDSRPIAFSYDTDRMEYLPMTVHTVTLALPGLSLAVPCVVTEEGNTFFAAASENACVYQGDIGDMAVVLADGTLYLADSTEAICIAEHVATVWSVHTEQKYLLYTDTDGILYEYRDEEGENTSVCISAGHPVLWAWYVYGTDTHTIVCQTETEDGVAWYFCEDGDVCKPAVLPSLDERDAVVFVRDTACILAGTNDSAYFWDIRTGDMLDMDVGGLYRFPMNTDADTLTVSPDGRFVYFYDIDFIYRLDLSTADLSLAYNEALIFEGSCVLSSMTVVTDEIILLSQASNEYTEFVPTVTCAVFEEDIPEVRHEDEKIDLDSPH